MAASSSGDNIADPNLTPLLDVVLQLIMFFMITVNFVQSESLNEDILLPTAQAADTMDRGDDYIFLNLNKQGKLVGVIGAEDVNSEVKLKAFLQRERDARQRAAREKGRKGDVNIVVILRAHRDARYADVWDVLDMCSKAGYRRWQLRVLVGG